jgi:SAM-dependent methyltransferase
MAEVESRMWWYRIMHFLSIEAVTRHFKSKDVSIVDLGCGTGGMIQSLQENGYLNIEGVDLSEEAIKFAKNKKLDVVKGDLNDFTSFKLSQEKYDVVICNDVLIYMENEQIVTFLRQVNSILDEHGIIIINVPCFEAFRGSHDVAVGLLKRFNRARINTLLHSADYKLISLRYWPFLLSPIIFIIRQLSRIKFRKNKTVKSDVYLPPKFQNDLFYRLTRFELKMFKNTPWGSSAFLVLKKR